MALDGLRGLLALYVALYHLSNTFGDLKARIGAHTFIVENGWYAVDVFFLMSGLVMTYVYRDGFADGVTLAALRRYWWARVARLYPVHLVTLLVLAIGLGPFIIGTPRLAGGGRYAWDAFLANLLMLQGPWIPQLSWNYPSWSISAEWHAYAVFPLLVFMVRGVAVAAAVLLAGTLVTFAYYVTLPSVAEAPTNGLVVLIRALPLFLAGMALHELRGLSAFRSGSLAALLGLGTLVCLASATLAPLALLLAPPLVLAVIGGSWLTRLLERPVLVWLGEISYSLYMVHALVQVFVANRIEDRLSAHGPASSTLSVVVVLASLALALVLASLMHRFVELPSRRFLTRRMTPQRGGR